MDSLVGKDLNMSAKVFIIAEAGVNHNGSPELAYDLVRAAARAGADAVKFQTFNAERLVAPGTAKAAYQSENTGAGDQLTMLRSLQLSEDTHRRLCQLCAENCIEFMSTPFDYDSADFLVSLGMKRIKVPSGELTNHPFLAYLARKKLPVILSTGMADLNEIEDAANVLRREWTNSGENRSLKDLLTILHCTSDYPAKLQDVNLRAMHTIGERIEVPVGYSDHTQGILASIAAVSMGACVVEKHFTLDKTLPGPDHKASLSIGELEEMVASIRAVEIALGSSEKSATQAELPVRALVRRSVVAVSAIAKGDVLSQQNIALLRPGTGIPPSAFAEVMGRRVKNDVPAGQPLTWDDLQK
jgi:N,N'-diacetyllegionaminate synthase